MISEVMEYFKPKEETCPHEFILIKWPQPPNSGFYEEKCKLCGKLNWYDTSD